MMQMKCPKCGCPAQSIEPDKLDRMLRGDGEYYRVNIALLQAPAPFKLARLVALGGREIYKRMPGGGAKRCTNPDCNHQFK